jgi:hypothetical protein
MQTTAFVSLHAHPQLQGYRLHAPRLGGLRAPAQLVCRAARRVGLHAALPRSAGEVIGLAPQLRQARHKVRFEPEATGRYQEDAA